jgi:futalosine hydrolase
MRVLVAAATPAEVAPFVAKLGDPVVRGPRVNGYTTAAHQIDVLITGVGMVAAATWCSRSLIKTRYDLALNLGVCGSFNPAHAPEQVVHVVADRMAELGAEAGESFLTIQAMELMGPNEFPFTGGELVNANPPQYGALSRLPAVRGITVNTVHGNARSIAAVTERFRPDVESMEGAGFMYACLVHGLPFAQVRAVSNIVETRNRSVWKLPEAIESLTRTALNIIEQA